MPTLDELRRWARGESVEGLPEISPLKAVEPPKPGPGRESRKYKLNPDGTDALLQFGTFHGHAVSALVMTSRGRKYCRWILDRDFDEALKAACRYQMEMQRRDK